MYNYNYSEDYLMHYGVKGMKWGVRRYQNKDGSLTPVGKKRQTMDMYKDAGASRRLQRSHGYETLKETRLVNKTSDALERLQNNGDNPEYSNKQRAKDYDTAIRGLNRLRGSEVTRSYNDADYMRRNSKKIEKLSNKKRSEKNLSKIKQLTMDNKLMGTGIDTAGARYKKYNDLANNLIATMAQDKAVVYTTKYRTLAMSGGDEGYEFRGTDYKVRANTKSRSNSKKYNDKKRKKQYDDKISKYVTVYV